MVATTLAASRNCVASASQPCLVTASHGLVRAEDCRCRAYCRYQAPVPASLAPFSPRLLAFRLARSTTEPPGGDVGLAGDLVQPTLEDVERRLRLHRALGLTAPRRRRRLGRGRGGHARGPKPTGLVDQPAVEVPIETVQDGPPRGHHSDALEPGQVAGASDAVSTRSGRAGTARAGRPVTGVPGATSES